MLKVFCHGSLENNLYKEKGIAPNDFKLFFMEW